MTDDATVALCTKPEGKLRVIFQGGSIAALASASLLADAGYDVLIFEKDADVLVLDANGAMTYAKGRVPGRNEDGSIRRAGVPQFRQLHTMLGRGLIEFENIIPGFVQALKAAGAVPINFLTDTCGHNFNGYYPDCWRPGIECADGVSATRELYETVIRTMVLRKTHGNLTFLLGHTVDDLSWDAPHRRITGVQSAGRIFEADIVVDASGQRSQTLNRLSKFGYVAGEDKRAQTPCINLAYATRLYRLPEDTQTKLLPKKIIVTVSTPPLNRNGYIQPVENGFFQVNLSGYNQLTIPKSDEEILNYARSLPTADVLQALECGKPIGSTEPFQRPKNTRVEFEKMDLPDGLFILGDAACAFNPVYGQGMTMAARGAVALRDLLDEHVDVNKDVGKQRYALIGLNKTFQKRLSKLLDAPWVMSTGEDDRRAKGPARMSLLQRLLSQYNYFLQKVAQVDPHVHLRLFRIVHLLDPLTMMFAPIMLRSVFKYWVTKAFHC